ncbi:TonB-dependent receptor [Sphingobacterium faecale]|uniref:TonB-dependent receptor n=1 Tax=Sphingobacterium faecale TaxID=2803775 RepID=A0ABS1QXU4_9SPHI|nr:TonB-dependent receptor [Sphingobacterium faecale]MBL1407248.1 TonB-dependent receptor [Sphingobacterium faecale]
MKIYITLVLTLFSIVSLQAQHYLLQGTVSDTEGKTIPSATIRVQDTETKTLTSATGKYSLQVSSPKITVVLSAVGYKSTIRYVHLISNPQLLDFTLETDHQYIDQVSVQGKRINANTETLIKLENSIMPVTVIDRRTIELMGSRRLDEVVKEQTGIAVVNDVGGGSRSVGVQMQGFGSEYIMVLIDGQPMVGRNGGNFDLSRISVNNVERVEITKGAASLLYGGDALGGTINVITKQVVSDPQAMASVNYGTNQTVDISVDGETPIIQQKGSIAINANYYHTGGFNTSQGTISGTTAPPYDNYGTQARLRYKFNENNRLSASVRYGLRRSFMSKDFGVNFKTEDILDEADLNLSANFEHRFSTRWRSMTRYYFTHYNADMSIMLSQGDSINQTKFGQLLNRLEQQIAYNIPGVLDIITGAGGTIEKINQNILSNENKITSYFGYMQSNWTPTSKLEITGGLRYDYIVNYGWRLDPSMALKYKILPTLTAKAAYGTAFKAPDMRKLYQVFYNPAYNYMMVGSSVLRSTINELRESGQVSQYELEGVYDEIKGLSLNAEMSKSYNASLLFENPDKRLRVEGSIFYHDITNQINPVLVGRDIQGGLIYAYRNFARAYYQGAEIALTYSPIANLQVSGGYQYLEAKDRTVKDEIREGGKYNVPLFDPYTGFVNHTPSASDYWGIENRSVHMFNGRIFYTYRPLDLSANVRVNYRGRYPFSDKNNNGYMDRFDTFVRGHYLLNAGIEKKIPKYNMSLRITTENLLNFVDQKAPSQPGRLFFVGLSYHLHNNL